MTRFILSLACLVSTPALGQEAPKAEDPPAEEPKECVETPAVTCPEESATEKTEDEPAPVGKPTAANDLILEDVRHGLAELSEEVRTEDIDTHKRERGLRKDLKVLKKELAVLGLVISAQDCFKDAAKASADATDATKVSAPICEAGLVEKLEELTERVTVIETALTAIGTQVGTNTGKIEGLAGPRGRVTINENKLGTLLMTNGTIHTLQNDIEGLRHDLTLVSEDVERLLGRSFGITTGVCLDVSMGPGIPASAGFSGIGPISLAAGPCATIYWETMEGSGVEIFVEGGLNRDRGFEGGASLIAYKRTGTIVIGGGAGVHGSSYDHWYQTGAGGTSNGVRLQGLVRWEPSKLAITARPYLQFGQDTNTEKAAPATKAGIVMSIALKHPY